jgi:hypothetical protein
MGALAGFVLGYILGVKAGPEGLEELSKAWEAITNSEEFKELLAVGVTLVGNVINQGGQALGEALAVMAAQDGKAGGAPTGTRINADLIRAWSTIAQSPQVQALLASGISFIGNILAQKRAMGGEQAEKH